MYRTHALAGVVGVALLQIERSARFAKLLPIHGQMSGSIADNTFSHNKGGQYVRQRRVPTNPNSVKQQAARTILATLSAAWRTLSATNQQAWNNWAVVNPVTD